MTSEYHEDSIVSPIAFNLRNCDFDDVIDANHQLFANIIQFTTRAIKTASGHDQNFICTLMRTLVTCRFNGFTCCVPVGKKLLKAIILQFFMSCCSSVNLQCE